MAPYSSTLAWKIPWTGGAWWATVHGVARSRTRLSDFTFTFPFHALEEEMATHSSVLAWRIPGTGEPGGPPSMGLQRVRHDWSNLAAAGLLMNTLINGGSDGKASAYNEGDPVWFLGREDPLEREMAIHSSTLAWKIPWTEEPDRLQSMGSQRVGHDWATSLHFTSLHFNEHLIPNVRWILYRRREGILCASYQERLYERRRKSETSAFLSFPFNESSLILNFVTCSLNFSLY